MTFIQRETVRHPEQRTNEPPIDQRIPVAVLANYNIAGDIRPEYVHLPDSHGMIHTYRILDIVYQKKTHYVGQEQLRYGVRLDAGGLCNLKELIYDIEKHMWWLSSKEL